MGREAKGEEEEEERSRGLLPRRAGLGVEEEEVVVKREDERAERSRVELPGSLEDLFS